MKPDCSIISDLMPLCAEALASVPSMELVRAHVAQCPDCAAKWAALQHESALPPTPTLPLRRMKRALTRRRMHAALLALCLTAAVLISLFAYLTAPQPFSYTPDLLKILPPTRDGARTIEFAPGVTGCWLAQINGVESGAIYQVCAYTTLWDRLADVPTRVTADVPAAVESLYYAPNPGGEDVLLQGAPLSGGIITLPRLTLRYYFVLAIMLTVILAALRVIFRKTAAAQALTSAVLLPASYALAQLCIKGTHFTTYTLQRDLALITLLTAAFWCAGAALMRYKSRKAPDARRTKG